MIRSLGGVRPERLIVRGAGFFAAPLHYDADAEGELELCREELDRGSPSPPRRQGPGPVLAALGAGGGAANSDLGQAGRRDPSADLEKWGDKTVEELLEATRLLLARAEEGGGDGEGPLALSRKVMARASAKWVEMHPEIFFSLEVWPCASINPTPPPPRALF